MMKEGNRGRQEGMKHRGEEGALEMWHKKDGKRKKRARGRKE